MTECLNSHGNSILSWYEFVREERACKSSPDNTWMTQIYFCFLQKTFSPRLCVMGKESWSGSGEMTKAVKTLLG